NGFPTTQVDSGSSGTFAVVDFANKSKVTIDAQGGNDTISVGATAAGTATTVNAGGDVDTVTVGNASTGLGDLAGALTIDGGGRARQRGGLGRGAVPGGGQQRRIPRRQRNAGDAPRGRPRQVPGAGQPDGERHRPGRHPQRHRHGGGHGDNGQRGRRPGHVRG